MQRRDVLKLLGSVMALSALPAEALEMLHHANAQAETHAGVRTLNPHQNATVITMTELIIPTTDTPGAKDAKVNEFFDLLLTEWFEPAEKAQFLAGLDDVDARSKKQFSAAFVDGSPAQQTALLKTLDDAAMQRIAEQKKGMHAHDTGMNFFYQFKKLTLAGYYTSKIGFMQELGRPEISVGYTGCAPVKETR